MLPASWTVVQSMIPFWCSTCALHKFQRTFTEWQFLLLSVTSLSQLQCHNWSAKLAGRQVTDSSSLRGLWLEEYQGLLPLWVNPAHTGHTPYDKDCNHWLWQNTLRPYLYLTDITANSMCCQSDTDEVVNIATRTMSSTYQPSAFCSETQRQPIGYHSNHSVDTQHKSYKVFWHVSLIPHLKIDITCVMYHNQLV